MNSNMYLFLSVTENKGNYVINKTIKTPIASTIIGQNYYLSIIPRKYDNDGTLEGGV